MDTKKRKKWLLRRVLDSDKAEGNNQLDKSPWASDDGSGKPYNSGATGPSIVDESSKSYPSNSDGKSYLETYLGVPGSDYNTQTHGI